MFGFSRDDAGPYIGFYLDRQDRCPVCQRTNVDWKKMVCRMCKATIDKKAENILEADPFEVLDQEGVGAMMKWAIQEGRKTRPGIKLGICGEHGGEPSSVAFCHELGLNYVSCSPYRVPIARLAAAQAALAVLEREESQRSSKKAKEKKRIAIANSKKKVSKKKTVTKISSVKKPIAKKPIAKKTIAKPTAAKKKSTSKSAPRKKLPTFSKRR
jgi:pyruvate,orthophosphate dikinase